MSDPVLTFVILTIFFAALAVARWFETLDSDFFRGAASPFAAGIVCGLLLLAIDRAPALHAVLTGIVLTIAAIYVRHIGDESEAAGGMLIGALTGASAAIPAAIWSGDGPRLFSELAIAGTVSGYGITIAVFHVADRSRQLAIDGVTALMAVGGAAVPELLERFGVSQRLVAISVAGLIPLLSAAGVFARWRSLRTELDDEALHGFMADDDVRRSAHPLLRFGRGGWSDAGAHREFVRIANRIALRKRHQRNRPDEVARLYQLEIIKLRMQLQEMARIGRLPGASETSDDDVPSDRMHG